MSDILATYTFLPWLRQGIANNIIQGDNDPAVILRASIPIDISVASVKTDGSNAPNQEVHQSIKLYGPGDIIGVDPRVIIKMEPRNWITNFEPNYLAFIEFYEEDFPWRYTPARHNTDRLRPWLTLVVLKEDEFEDGANIKDKPLPFFKMKSGKKANELFPKSSELWAWAHVHVNSDLSKGALPNTANADAVTAEITNIINQNPDHAYSRIICPRKLEENTGYHAFLIPTFESGRLSGLGLDLPNNLVATKCGWDTEYNIEFPYYHRWYFRTGNVGDFEYLVNLLKPKPADKKIGVRDMDVLHPGSNLPKIDSPADLNGILKLGGALRVPLNTMKPDDKAEVLKYDQWDEDPYPHPFEIAMAQRINLADDYTDPAKDVEIVNHDANIILVDGSDDPDPVITSPLYGRWHALTQRLLKSKTGSDLPNNKNWIHELNLDPRFRVPSGFGTKVVQKSQEEYMQAAWEQVGNIIEANNKIRLAQMAKEVSFRFYTKHLLPLNIERAFIFTAPVQKRIVYKELTVFKQVQESIVPLAVTSGTFRSITRPRGRIMKKLAFTENIKPDNLIERINDKEIEVAPPKTDPESVIKLTDLVAALQPQGIPPFIENELKKNKWLISIPLIILFLTLIIILLFFRTPLGFGILGVMASGLIWLFNILRNWSRDIELGDALKQENLTPEAIDKLPESPNFEISEPGSGFTPAAGNSDSIEAKNFKLALKDAYTFLQISFPEPVRKKLEFSDITKKVIDSINPAFIIPKRTFDMIKIPGRILDNMVETFTPVMAYPEIDVPMFKPLADMSSELFLPNINLIEQNSITLLENNQKFIEAYMVGINHEMSRELLWREYPTDQRGTYFRQFWDVSSFLPPQPVPDNLKEQLRDIPPIHRWYLTSSASEPKRNELGHHNQRVQNSGEAKLVLVIRGELLKKYPTAVVYAQKADWGKNSSEVRDVNEERVFVELTDAEKLNPPLDKIKTPLFEAKIEPDIYFFGFDLTDVEAKGKENPTSTSDNPGWFFVIKERFGEPRFGLDLNKANRIINWNNLSWEDVGTADGKYIELNRSISFIAYDEDIDQENRDTKEDTQAQWNPDTDSAELAYILYQVPVLVGVHASRMLASA
ncbi:MAG: hypothetical protein M3R36_04000 [Bacteroidota bacterium]|nr:hypothetical protein [Bacteroidota bacterium]